MLRYGKQSAPGKTTSSAGDINGSIVCYYVSLIPEGHQFWCIPLFKEYYVANPYKERACKRSIWEALTYLNTGRGRVKEFL